MLQCSINKILHDQKAFYFQISLHYENSFGKKRIPVLKTFLYSSLTAYSSTSS